MNGTVWIVCMLLAGIVGAVLTVLLSDGKSGEEALPGAFAVLPVPEASPEIRAFLEFYASQIAWMDARVLQCVILVCTPESEALCRDMAQHYSCYTVMPLPEVQAFLAEQCGEKFGKS